MTIVESGDATRRAARECFLAARRRIGADAHRAWTYIADDGDLERMSAADGPLAGLSVGVKDIIDVAGMPTRCGSEITDAGPKAASADLVEAIVALGAVVLGKTVTTEFAYFSPGPTENPRAPGHTPGGSSSGSAAAVAAGHVHAALGSQTAGSLTRPAAYCGVFGLVLPHGAVSTRGFSGLSESLDSAGVLASRLDVLSQVSLALGVWESDAAARRAFLWPGDALENLSEDMRRAVQIAADAIAERASVQMLEDDDAVAALAADHHVVMGYEAARQRPDLVGARDRLSRPLAALLAEGLAVSDETYAASVARIAETRERLRVLLGGDGFIIGPAAPGAAPEGLVATGSPIMSRPWQALGFAQVTVPGLTDSKGLPLGMQVIAPTTGTALAAAELLTTAIGRLPRD